LGKEGRDCSRFRFSWNSATNSSECFTFCDGALESSSNRRLISESRSFKIFLRSRKRSLLARRSYRQNTSNSIGRPGAIKVTRVTARGSECAGQGPADHSFRRRWKCLYLFQTDFHFLLLAKSYGEHPLTVLQEIGLHRVRFVVSTLRQLHTYTKLVLAGGEVDVWRLFIARTPLSGRKSCFLPPGLVAGQCDCRWKP
jgi:hypothetical protein